MRRILREGQASGELADVDVHRDDLDPTAVTHETSTLFHRTTRATGE